MAQLGRFDETYSDPGSGRPRVGASVAVYREGATVSGNQSGTTPLTVNVRHRGKIVAADTVFLNLAPGTTYTVNSVTATTVVLSGFAGTLVLTNGDRLIPSNSQPTLYSDDFGGATTGNPLTTNANGRVNCWLNEGNYDIVVSIGSTALIGFHSQYVSGENPAVRYSGEADGASAVAYVDDTINSLATAGAKLKSFRNLGTEKAYIDYAGHFSGGDRKNIATYAPAGVGTAASPWTGWESAVVEGAQNYFPAGFYGTSTGLDLQLANNNQPGKTSLVGDGYQSTFLVGTANVTVLRIRGITGSPATMQCYVEDLDISTNVTNTQANGLFSYEGGDSHWCVRNLSIRNRNATNAANFTVTLGARFFNCQQGTIENLFIRAFDTTNPFTTGLLFDTNDAFQRGNVTLIGGTINNALTAVNILAVGGNAYNNCSFIGTKAVLGSTSAGSIAFSMVGQADQTNFTNCHIEKYDTGYYSSSGGPDSITIVGGLIATAVTGISINTGDGWVILAPRMSAVTNGVVITGTSRNVYWFQGRHDTVTTPWTNSSNSATNGPVRINGGRWLEDVYTGTSLDVTPNVALGSILKTANAGATVITNFTNGIAGQRLTVLVNDANTTINNNANIKNRTGANITPGINTTRSYLYDGTAWWETS